MFIELITIASPFLLDRLEKDGSLLKFHLYF